MIPSVLAELSRCRLQIRKNYFKSVETNHVIAMRAQITLDAATKLIAKDSVHSDGGNNGKSNSFRNSLCFFVAC